jgi:hypothetical protein
MQQVSDNAFHHPYCALGAAVVMTQLQGFALMNVNYGRTVPRYDIETRFIGQGIVSGGSEARRPLLGVAEHNLQINRKRH